MSMTPGLWLLVAAFFAVMGGLVYAYVRIARWAFGVRDEAISALPHLTVTLPPR